ncbi:hypothetical protein LTR86_008525 [Recurvomyces mirabilis]|nr:hypothetical protein LTR86_008525 [Recurvomyces mirabilis]
MAPPRGFVDLATAYRTKENTFVNIIGVTVDLMPPKVASSGQWMFTFKLLDPSLRDSLHGSSGLTIRYFKQDQSHLPQVQEHGDIVLLRNIKMVQQNGQPLALSHFQTGAQIFSAASIPNANYSIAFQGTNRLESRGTPDVVRLLTLEEQAYVMTLKGDINVTQRLLSRPQQIPFERKRDTAPVTNAMPPAKRSRQDANDPPSGFGKKFRLIKDTRHLTFADLVVQVVKNYNASFGACELYVTDYTENQDMFKYKAPEEETSEPQEGDTFGYNSAQRKSWPGPYGWYVLKINAKDPHATFANTRVKEGDFVLLRNVKIKAMAEGSKLEGDMWRDDMDPDKVKITLLPRRDIPEIVALQKRKEAYWAKRQMLQPEVQGEPVKLTKAEKKQQKKLKKQEERAKAAAAEAKVAERNQHIRCSNEEAALMGVKDVLDPDNARHTNNVGDGKSYVLPFVNAQYRTKVHVVGHEPKALADFAVPPLPDEDAEPSPIDALDWEASQKYEWHFSLLLEDASSTQPGTEKPKIWAHVRHEDAQFLFGNDMDDPQDLRSNPQLLSKLREKLCILWGNLEEKGDQEVTSNRPFECCLQEYGIELDEDDPEKSRVPFGYKKLFRMFGTTIL